jgi:hypothetical protein
MRGWNRLPLIKSLSEKSLMYIEKSYNMSMISNDSIYEYQFRFRILHIVKVTAVTTFLIGAKTFTGHHIVSINCLAFNHTPSILF